MMTHAQQTVAPLLMFAGQAEEAMRAYCSNFERTEILHLERYGPEGPGADGSVIRATLSLDGQMFLCLDSSVTHDFTSTPAISFAISCATQEEIERLFGRLAQGCTVFMPLAAYPFSPLFAWVADRFGVSWQRMLDDQVWGGDEKERQAMLLEHKVAVVYGAGGPIGRAVARAFAREGAHVFLAGRTQAPLDAVAEAIRVSGGRAETVIVDALDEQAVAACVASIVSAAGAIDISFNLIGFGDVQQPLLEIAADEFLRPIVTATRSQFLTTRAAARHMVPRGSGVILAFGGSGPQTIPGMGGVKVAFDAVESLRRQWATELGAHGIRVVTLKTGGIPETIPTSILGREQIVAGITQAALLPYATTLDDVGTVAAFVASDGARTMTGSEVNISCGALLD
jgi:3-oxoacyl-[acyl-carrier protein] reductase